MEKEILTKVFKPMNLGVIVEKDENDEKNEDGSKD